MTMTMNPHTNRRTVPYFALGHEFDEPVSVEMAFAQAGLRFNVEHRPLYYDFEREDVYGSYMRKVDVEGNTMLVRDDTQAPLGIVGNKYTIIQNSEVEEVLDASGWKATAAGFIDQGQRAFAVLVDEDYSHFTVGGDPFFAFMVARWNHDGSGGIKIGPQIWRQWCTNGQKRIEAQQYISIKHLKSKDIKMIHARELMPQMENAVEQFALQAEFLQGQTFMRSEAQALLREVFPKPEQKGTIEGHNRALTRYHDKLSTLYKILDGETLPDTKRYTAFGVVQTVNEFEQWFAQTKTIERSQLLRLDADRFPATEKALVKVGAWL